MAAPSCGAVHSKKHVVTPPKSHVWDTLLAFVITENLTCSTFLSLYSQSLQTSGTIWIQDFTVLKAVQRGHLSLCHLLIPWGTHCRSSGTKGVQMWRLHSTKGPH